LTENKTTRRNFLKLGAAGVVGLAIGGGVGYEIARAVTGAPAVTTETVTQIMSQTGAASPSLSLQPGTTLNFLVMSGPRYAQAVTPVVQAFTKATGVNVNLTTGGYGDIQPKIATELASMSSTYDMMWIDYEYIGTYMANKWLLPLDNYVAQYPPSDFDTDFPDRVTSMYRYPFGTGTWYAIPIDANMEMQFYRADKTNAATSWDDALTIAKTLNNPPSAYGLVADWASGFGNAYYEGLFWGYGGQVYNPQTYEPGFESDAGMNALKLLSQVAQYAPSEAVNWIEDQTFEAWTKGSTFFNPDEWGFSAYQVPSLNPYATQTKSTGVPLVSSTTMAADTPWNVTAGECAIMGGYGVGIPLNSAHPNEAYGFIKFYLENLDIATQNTAQPPRISMLEKYYNLNPVQYQLFDTLVKNMNLVNIRPVVPEALQMDAILSEQVDNYLTGQDATTTLKNIDDNIRAIFIKEGKYSGTVTTTT